MAKNRKRLPGLGMNEPLNLTCTTCSLLRRTAQYVRDFWQPDKCLPATDFAVLNRHQKSRICQVFGWQHLSWWVKTYCTKPSYIDCTSCKSTPSLRLGTKLTLLSGDLLSFKHLFCTYSFTYIINLP